MAKQKTTKKKRNPDALEIDAARGEDAAKASARAALRPTVSAALTSRDYLKAHGKLDLSYLVESLVEQTQMVIDGDLGRAEAMLSAQAHTLDTIFNNLARRAINAEYMGNLDTYLKLALRAQSQCRATWEALSAIKNPPVMGYVRQANIAHGPQQVNNAPLDDPPRARENENLQNKQLEQKDGERVDPGTTGTTSQDDQEMATVGKVDGAENSRR